MIETITSIDFLLPLICITLLFFFGARLYSLRNMSVPKLVSEFNLAFGLGKIFYQLYLFLIVAYIIVSFINGIYILSIITTFLGALLGRLLLRNKNLSPSTAIPFQIMTINCISISVVFIVLLIYIFGI